MAKKEDDMLLLSAIAEATGISVDTLRYWARTEQLDGAELKTMPTGPAWYATVSSAESRANKEKTSAGRPIKRRKTGA